MNTVGHTEAAFSLVCSQLCSSVLLIPDLWPAGEVRLRFKLTAPRVPPRFWHMNPSPLEAWFDSLEAAFIRFGEDVRIVGELDGMELEYASIRKAAAMLDCPFRGLIRLTGADRLPFLNRLLTNDCSKLAAGDVQRSFMLTAQGRIMADLVVIERGDSTLIDLDAYQAPAIAAELDKLLFGEDVQITDLTATHHRISLHGPKARRAAEWWGQSTKGVADVWQYRHDEIGEAAYHLWAPAAAFEPIPAKHVDLRETFDLRPIGWLAYNIARIEAGRPMFNVDFGTTNLPHETGILAETVSFTKGCYRGQEIVARMQSLGHPAKVLVGFRAQQADVIPIAGVPVYAGASADTDVVGAVTSSTFSPLLSNAPVGFAMVKWSHRAIGTQLFAPAEGHNVPIAVHELQFVPSHT